MPAPKLPVSIHHQLSVHSPLKFYQITDFPDHPPLHRNYTYPPDPVVTTSSQEFASSASSSKPDVVGPSLVTRLQKMHGLTKKKVYGSQPVQEPFIRDDRVRDKYRQ